MSQTAISIDPTEADQQQKYDASAARVDMKLEVALIPVSDVDRAKEFYTKLGWRLDADDAMGNDFRIVQLTPPARAARSRSARGSHPRCLAFLWVG
jgi:hypothetical protein